MSEVISCDCGLTYVPGPDDEEHRQHHSDYLNGPIIPALSHLRSSQTVDKYALFVIDRSVSLSIRREITAVAIVAQGSMQDYPVGYDGSINDSEQTMLLLASGSNVVATVLIALESPFWTLNWSADGRLVLVESTPSQSKRHTVGRVWVAKSYRRRGLATVLIKMTAEHFRTGIGELGWELPLTDDGAQLLRKVLPGKWFGRGDGFAVRETLDKHA